MSNDIEYPGGPARRRGVFQIGQWVQLTDEKGRVHTTLLAEKGFFQCHQGSIRHESIIGQLEGSIIPTVEGRHNFTALRPLLVDYHLSMPRGAQIIYPKDAAQIVLEGDIFPGAVVVEAGVGSGALSMALLGAIGEHGRLHSVERRGEFADIARANVEMWFSGRLHNWQLSLGSLSEVLAAEVSDDSVDRVVLDMLAPWENLAQCWRVLRPGGVLTCYVATVTQLSRLTEELRNTQRFTSLRAWETMSRPWHVDGLAVRPEHRMIGHTGFILTARALAAGYKPIRRGEEPSEFLELADNQALDVNSKWEPAHVGEREKSAAKIRRVRRDTLARAEKLLGSHSSGPIGPEDEVGNLLPVNTGDKDEC